MNQKGFSYIELSIASTVFSMTAVGLLSLLASLTTSVQELNLIGQVREQANIELVNALAGAGVPPISLKIKSKKLVTSSPLSKKVTLKSAKLTEMRFSSSQQGKDFNIRHIIATTVLPSPPASIYTVHQLNRAYKPVR